MADITLWGVPASHPCVTVERALERKGLHYRRIDLLPGLAAGVQRVRFGRRTVPGLELDGRRIVGSREILRALDAHTPEPPLYPREPERRAAVEEAERWGDEVLQETARWITVTAVSRQPPAAASFLAGSKLPQMPAPVAAVTTKGLYAVERRLLGRDDANVRELLRALPGQLDRVDALIAEGVLGGEEPNAADLQIAPSLRLLLCVADVAPLISGRPCGRLAALADPVSGHVEAGALPAAWLPMEGGSAS